MGEERERIVVAVGRMVADYGYAKLTLEQVLRQAQVSEGRFLAHFESLEQAVLVAQVAFLDRVRLEIVAACDLDRPWPENVRAALDAALNFFAEAAELARGFMVEATAFSLAASERHFDALDVLAELLRQGRRFYPRAEPMPEALERALIGGVASIVCDRLLAERAQSLVALEPQLAEFLLVPYLGRAEANRFTSA